MMKKYRFFTAIGLMAALLFTACSQDELTDDNALPEGKYPLEIASVTMEGESSAQPWGAKEAQTRVSENEDGTGSVWETGDEFYVKFQGSDQVGKYRIKDAATGTVKTVTPVYWQSASTEQTIIAWYAPRQEGAIDVSNQTDKLAYVIRAERTATCNNGATVSLQFAHQLAKVRVYLRGTAYEGNATGVTLSYPASYTLTEGKVAQATSATNGTIQMHKPENADYYEASVLPGQIATNGNPFTVTLNDGKTASVDLSAPLTLTEGSKHDVTLRLHKQGTTEIDLSSWNGNPINDNGIYYFTGTGSTPIQVTGGSPNIYLEDATVSVGVGPAINIAAGNPTIHVVGADNSVKSSDSGAGIYVAEGHTVTIKGRSRDDALTAQGHQNAAGVGGYFAYYSGPSYSCGNIIIQDVTLTAISTQTASGFDYAAGIGAVGNSTVGSISISNAVIYAYGNGAKSFGGAAIGGGVSQISDSNQTAYNITISESELHLSRKSTFASYIGAGGSQTNPANYNIISTASITDSVIYDENGNELTQ